MSSSLGTACVLILLLSPSRTTNQEHVFLDDVCGHINGQRIYLEYGEIGTLEAKYQNNVVDRFFRGRSDQKRCTVEFISCPSCVINIKFKYLNLSRSCGRSTVFDACACDYVWIYEPSYEESSEQFCGRFVPSNFSNLGYKSQTRKVFIEFLYNDNYWHAFTLDYFSERNKVVLVGSPNHDKTNNMSQIIGSPFFPNFYPSDLTMEYFINCESKNETCRISLVFTDFLIALSSILDFYDWNGEQIYVTTGNIFRPPVITTSGPSLLIRFYANGATDLGFKAYYSFILGHISERHFTPDIDCGGQVNNLGGAITMMDMVPEGLKSFDCIWLIKPPETYLHMKTHLYVKVVNFSGFAGSTELIIRQGLTSNGPLVENLKLSLMHFNGFKGREHVVTISQGFYIKLKGLFRSESRLALVYAAFNYKECLTRSDFLCHNKRCVSGLLKCDGFDHCGDNSDEFTIRCSKDSHDRREWAKRPHFLFPKGDGLSDLATSTMVFLLCSFGLIGFIFAMIILLYRINIKSRHQRQIQDHIETINAILEEGVGVIEEEIIIPDDPPDYEAPPEYEDIIKTLKSERMRRCSRCNNRNPESAVSAVNVEENFQGTSRSCLTTPKKIPDSPPPTYESQNFSDEKICNFFKNSDLRENILLNARRLIYTELYKTKYFSDSQLSISTNTNHVNICGFKRSFTTDDVVNSFI